MFQQYMTSGALTPYTMALFKAANDVGGGLLSLLDAARLYAVDAEAIDQFLNDMREYDKFNRGIKL
jgi:hypothetical protein